MRVRGIWRIGGKIGLGERRILPSLEPEEEMMDTISGRFVESVKRLREILLEGFHNFDNVLHVLGPKNV